MEYAEALKKVQATKAKENYMVVKWGYDSKIILPFKDGQSFLACLTNAETLKEPYNEQHRITAYERSSLEISIISNEEYVRIKVAALLGINPKELVSLETNT